MTEPSIPAAATPRRVPWHVLAPVLVLLLTALLLAGAAREALRPALPVVVRPVVPSSPDAADAADASAPGALRTVSDDAPAPASRRTVQAPGWLEADPFSVACTGLADGTVAEVLVLEGETVRAGEPMARLVDDDARLALASAESALASARARLALAEADVVAARTDWEEPVERERSVASSAAALAAVEAELARLPAEIAARVAALEGLEAELARREEARAAGAATDIEVILIRASRDRAAAEVDAERAREGILVARRDAAAAEHRAARRAYELRVSDRRALDVARASRDAAAAAVTAAEVRRDEAALRLERMTIRAPISGRVQKRFKRPGDMVMAGKDDPAAAQIALLYDPARLQVRVDVPLADAAQVAVGQACEVVVDVLPEATFEGVVTRITDEADLQKNTLQVKVRVIDPSPVLRPEMLTRVRFVGGADGGTSADASRGEAASEPGRRTVLVAADCIDAGERVWRVRDRHGARGRLEPVAVERVGGGAAREGWIRVRATLRPGDLLAVPEAGRTLAARVLVRMQRERPQGGAA